MAICGFDEPGLLLKGAGQLERLQWMRLGHAVPPPVKVELSR